MVSISLFKDVFMKILSFAVSTVNIEIGLYMEGTVLLLVIC